MKKVVIYILLVTAFLGWMSPLTVRAVDQRCWQEDECKNSEFGGGFYGPNSETIKACGTDTLPDEKGTKIGFCTPNYQAQTKISFAGVRDFENFGEFIKFMYRYAIVIAGIFAVIMIIMAGVGWVTSGGSPEKITDSKKKIGNALMGLLLAVLSYFILSTVNPYLTNFRLPTAWLINNQGLAPLYCNRLEDDKKVIYFADQGAKYTQIDKENKEKNSDVAKVGVLPSGSLCGAEYIVPKTGAQTCWGLSCPASGGSPRVCTDYINTNPIQPYGCVNGMLAGKIVRTDFFDISDDIVDEVTLYAACKNGDIEDVKSVDPNTIDEGKLESYAIPYDASISSVCSSKDGLIGFYLGIQVNDETGGAGKVLPGTFVVSWGIDDHYAVGQAAPGSNLCTVNLAKVVYRLVTGVEPECKGVECTCAGASFDPAIASLKENKEYIGRLISLEELKKGYRCDIKINRSEFPAASNFRDDYYFHSLKQQFATLGIATVFDAGLSAFKGVRDFADDPTSCEEFQNIF